MTFTLKLKVAMLTILAAGGLAVMPSIYSPAFASNLVTGDAAIPTVNTDATGEAQFDSNAQAAALGDSAAASSSGSDISYEIDVQNIEEITAADIQAPGGEQ